MPGGKTQPKPVSRPPGSRAGPVCEPRVQEDAMVAFCRLLSSFPITLPAWGLLLLDSLSGRPSMKRKNRVFTDSFSLLWGKKK